MRTTRGTALLALALLLLAAAAGAQEKIHLMTDMIPANAAPEVLKAKALYEGRDGTGKACREMLGILEPYLQARPDDYDALMLASAAAFWIADRDPGDKEKSPVKKEFGEKGYKWAEKMIALKPEGVAGHYFYTINLGNYGEGISILKALSVGLDKLYRQHGEKARALDPTFEAGGADRALGRFYFKLPWPKYDADKSGAHLRASIALGPRKLRGYSYLADTLIKEKKYDEAAKVIQDGLAQTPYPFDQGEAAFYKDALKKSMAVVESKK